MRDDIRRAARRSAHRVALGAGRVTSRSRILPGFLIVGAQRCGTSSMYRALVQHPNVLPAGLNKGVHYFDVDFDRGTDWYRSHFPLRRTAAQVERRTGAPAVTFESSPYYMFHPLAGERIAAVLPGIKVICLLRDPVERAYSAHAHELARGFEDLAFEDAVEQEPRRLEGEIARMKQGAGYESHHLQHNAYVLRGEYVDQLERLALTLGRDNLHVVDSQDFFTDPLVAFQGVTDFLGLPRWDAGVFEQHNARPRQADMAAELRARLSEHYRPFDDRLAEWMDRTPSWRR